MIIANNCTSTEDGAFARNAVNHSSPRPDLAQQSPVRRAALVTLPTELQSHRQSALRIPLSSSLGPLHGQGSGRCRLMVVD